MKHLDDEQLIALYYGETQRANASNEHLRECATCRENFASLQQTLETIKNMPMPDRDASYGSQVWYAIAQRLDTPAKLPEQRHPFSFKLRRFAAVSAMASLIFAAFLAGRYWPRKPAQTAITNPTQIRQGVLLVAVSDHLDHAQMVLMELVNTDASQEKPGAPSATINISNEQQRAQELLASNRLYQQTAQQTGDAELENILNALEPVLLQIAHSPEEVSSQQFQEIQQRIQDAGILFKVRIVSSDVRDKERSLAQQSRQGQT